MFPSRKWCRFEKIFESILKLMEKSMISFQITENSKKEKIKVSCKPKLSKEEGNSNKKFN
jgi:hypothetical protein